MSGGGRFCQAAPPGLGRWECRRPLAGRVRLVLR
jgi:hypothetical protein